VWKDVEEDEDGQIEDRKYKKASYTHAFMNNHKVSTNTRYSLSLDFLYTSNTITIHKS
jgi:hypothetical protein